MVPADAAGYATKAGARYAVLWRQAGKGEQAVVYAGVPEAAHKSHTDAYKADGYAPATVQALAGADGTLRYSGTWSKGPGKPDNGELHWADAQPDHDDLVFAGRHLLLDVHLGPAPPPRPLRENLEPVLKKARGDALRAPKNPNPHFFQGVALFHLARRGSPEGVRRLFHRQQGVLGAPLSGAAARPRRPGAGGAARPGRLRQGQHGPGDGATDRRLGRFTWATPALP
jgi:hypothetical protein